MTNRYDLLLHPSQSTTIWETGYTDQPDASNCWIHWGITTTSGGPSRRKCKSLSSAEIFQKFRSCLTSAGHKLVEFPTRAKRTLRLTWRMGGFGLCRWIAIIGYWWAFRQEFSKLIMAQDLCSNCSAENPITIRFYFHFLWIEDWATSYVLSSFKRLGDDLIHGFTSNKGVDQWSNRSGFIAIKTTGLANGHYDFRNKRFLREDNTKFRRQYRRLRL